MTNPELLAPVGCEENFFAAVNFGADAVYIGLSDFSARKNAGNFSLERLPYILSYAHLFGVRVYIAVNTVIKNSELGDYIETIKKAYLCGADAFIVQDLFLGRYLKKCFPDICLHLSTQAGINNLDGAKLAASYGFSRVILARETPIEEIKKIAAFIETEVFVHGALCTCFSGHCYFSSFVGGKSGNRGLCRQPCRKLYKYEGKGIIDDYRFALSLSDLSLHEKVAELITTGVKSFKIEGRMRSFEYVCASCDFYSDILKGVFDRKKYENLLRTYNRGNGCKGLGFGQDERLISDKIQNHMGVIVGRVAGVSRDTIIAQNLKKSIVAGDCFKIIDEKEKGNCTALTTSKGIVLKYKGKAAVGDFLAITKDVSLIDKYRNVPKKLFPVEAKLVARVGEFPILTVNGMEFQGKLVCQQAVTAAVTKSQIKENLRKTDVYPFEVAPSCEIDKDIFIVKSSLNELRARAHAEYFNTFACQNEKHLKNVEKIEYFDDDYAKRNSETSTVAIISADFGSLSIVDFENAIFCPADYNDKKLFDKFFTDIEKITKNGNGIKTYLYVPAFLTCDDEKIITECSERFDGLYCEGSFGLFLAKRLKKEFFGGVELNVTNRLTYGELEASADKISLSKELSYDELKSMSSDGFVLCGGSIKIMSLEYCPFGKKCDSCKRADGFTLKDYDGRVFRVRRYKLSSCRFEIYNCLPLKADMRFENEIYDFTLLGDSERDYYSAIIANKVRSENQNKFLATSGNFKKGVE